MLGPRPVCVDGPVTDLVQGHAACAAQSGPDLSASLPTIPPVIQAVGYLGSAGAAVMWVPQALRAVRRRHQVSSLAGLSATAYIMAMVFNALLLTYGLLNHADPVVVAGTVNLACATVTVTVVLLARRTAT
jgi:uncharacterized protein with PQ loop repeat